MLHGTSATQPQSFYWPFAHPVTCKHIHILLTICSSSRMQTHSHSTDHLLIQSHANTFTFYWPFAHPVACKHIHILLTICSSSRMQTHSHSTDHLLMHPVTTTGTHYCTTTYSNCVFPLLYNVVYLPSISWMSSPILSITAPWRQRSEHMYMSSDIMKAKHTHTHTVAHRSLPCTHTHTQLSAPIHQNRMILIFSGVPKAKAVLSWGHSPSLLPWSWYLCLTLIIIIYRMETVKAGALQLKALNFEVKTQVLS